MSSASISISDENLDLVDIFNWNNSIDQFSTRQDPTFNRSNVPPTIISIYEPKFLEIYSAYKRYSSCNNPNVDLSDLSAQHLMSICLNNLIPFSNWARDISTSAFIRSVLFENPDMRPEVRNGLAMIVVYTFSAAKAHASGMSRSNSNGRGTAEQLNLTDAPMNTFFSDRKVPTRSSRTCSR